MKLLIVDQLSKTTGHDTFMLASKIQKQNDDMIVETAISDEYFGNDNGVRKHICFVNVYKGNFVKKTINYLKSLKRLVRLVKKEKYDFVLLNWFSLPWIENHYVKKIKKYSKVYIIIHDVIPFNVRPLEIKFLDKIYSTVNGLFVQNENAKAIYDKTFKNKTKVKTISSAFCDKNDFELIDKNESRERLSIPYDKFVYLYYGTIRNSKGLDTLIESFSKVHDINKDSFLLIGGAFSHVNPKYYLDLTNKYLDSSNSRVDFKFIDIKDEKFYFCASDCLVLPYKSGFQSGVAQLGLMYDLPMISSNIGELPNCVVAGFNGENYDANNPQQLTDCLLKIRNVDLKEYSINSKKLSETKYSLSFKANEIIDFMKSNS